MTRYLVTGGGGMLAADLAEALSGRDVTIARRADLDVTDSAAVDAFVNGYDVIINAAAYTKVDDAETHEDDAHAINAEGPANLARAAAATGAVLVQVSTDYVFNGTASEPYPEDTPRDPVSAYGRTKGDGERLALELNPDRTIIVRTAWLYGAGGNNFVKTMLKLAADRDTLTVVADQVGQPTWTLDLAQQIVALLDAGVTSGVFHGTNAGETSWHGFAQQVFTNAGLDAARVHPTTSAEFVRPAPRPAYSVLGHNAWATAGIPAMRDWQDALADAMARGGFGAAPQ